MCGLRIKANNFYVDSEPCYYNGIKAEEGEDDSLLSGGGCKDFDEESTPSGEEDFAESHIT